MTRNPLRLVRSFWRPAIVRDERGIAAVEFALLSTLMLTLMAGGVDLTNALIVQRDVTRLSNEIAQVLATCPDQDCVNSRGFAINAKVRNIVPGLDGVQIGFASILRKKDAISVESGSMTYLPPDMLVSAKNALADTDYGVAALISYTHKPVIINFAKNWGFNLESLSSSTVMLRKKG